MCDYNSNLIQGDLNFERYPYTSNRSLQVVNNADILAIKNTDLKSTKSIHLYNDRFGVWNCILHNKSPKTILNYASQKKAISQNLKRNNLTLNESSFYSPLDILDNVEVAFVKVPKSVELFEMYLQQIHKSSDENTVVVCSFMTKYFNSSLLKVASKYFEELTQSKAWKKARLLTLKTPKANFEYSSLKNLISWNDAQLTQFYGVFSSNKIDYGTQFLLEDLQVNSNELEVLDLASGNGVIAYEVLRLNLNAHITLLDDSFLAIESSRLNLRSNVTFICDDNLSNLNSANFDLVISNPPFHFEYENNIEVSIGLFKEVERCLKKDARFVLVANKHLNYKTHLQKIFEQVSLLKSNNRYEVLECVK